MVLGVGSCLPGSGRRASALVMVSEAFSGAQVLHMSTSMLGCQLVWEKAPSHGPSPFSVAAG